MVQEETPVAFQPMYALPPEEMLAPLVEPFAVKITVPEEPGGVLLRVEVLVPPSVVFVMPVPEVEEVAVRVVRDGMFPIKRNPLPLVDPFSFDTATW